MESKSKETEVEGISTFSFESIIFLLKTSKLKNETNTHLILKICSTFFENNSLSQAPNAEEYVDYIYTLLTNKKKKKFHFALQLLDIVLSHENEPIDNEQMEQIYLILLQTFIESSNNEVVQLLTRVFIHLIHSNPEQFIPIILEHISIVDLMKTHFSENIFSLIYEIFCKDQSLLEELHLFDMIPSMLEVISQKVKDFIDPLTLISILNDLNLFVTIASELSIECFSNFDLWESLNQFLEIPNSQIQKSIITIFTSLLQNQFFSFDDVFYSKIFTILINLIGNRTETVNTKLLIQLFDFILILFVSESPAKQQIFDQNIPQILIDNFDFFPFTLQKKTIDILYIVFESCPALLKLLKFDLDFTEALINLINETSNDSTIFSKCSSILINIIEKEKNMKGNSELFIQCKEMLDFDNLFLSHQEIAEYILDIVTIEE